MPIQWTHVPEFEQVIGPSQRVRGLQGQPGNSDYPAGGYVIKATDIGFGYAIFGAKIVAINAAGKVYIWQFQAPPAYFGATPTPQSTINLLVEQVNTGTGAIQEVAVNTQLASAYFVAEFTGF